jgi:iron-sulfur cluster repair protein YtfE (RIC family)
MLRDKNLIPLSRQHQRALALCVRIDRAQPIPDKDSEAWQIEVAQEFEQEIRFHFAAEEEVVFPAARRFGELIPLVEELISEHKSLRESFAQAAARQLSAEDLPILARQLSDHIRKEERQLFEKMQQLIDPPDLSNIGMGLEAALKGATHACRLPTAATVLKAR